MNLTDLQAVQNTERQKDSLQHLRESFYEDVADYIEGLEAERDGAAEQAEDPFASPEVRQLTDEIETAKEVVEAIYDRRLGKLVKRASLAAAGMSEVDEEGLTAEERELFADLVEKIESNKSHVLEVIDGDSVTPSSLAQSADAADAADATIPNDRAPDAAERSEVDASATDPVSGGEPGDDRDRIVAEEAAAITGEDSDAEATDPAQSAAAAMGGSPDSGTDAEGGSVDTATDTDESTADESSETGSDRRADGGDTADRTRVRIKRDIGEIFGVDDREYVLSSEDVVDLPAENAKPLVERGAAEKVD